jgi:polo-like kinase 1
MPTETVRKTDNHSVDGAKTAAKQIRVKTGASGLGGSVNLGGKSPQSDIWIVKWVDYSSKYGLGYLLLNDATGVFFNDSSKIVLSPCGTYFDYIER